MTQTLSLDRRHFLSASGALMLAAACQPAAIAPAARQHITRIGLQTYSLREALSLDFVGTFQMIKDVGYDFVELNGRNFADRAPTELRKILDDVGLPAPATHVDYKSLSETPSQLGDIAATLGCDYVILPWLADDQRGLEDYKRHAEMLNRAAEVLNTTNIKLAYHNHHFEFFDLGSGVTGMDILLSDTDPSLVSFELDFFWAALAGVDIPKLLAAHPGRFKLCHIKDMSGDPAPYAASLDFATTVQDLMVNVGEGTLPFETYFAQNSVSGMEYFIAEHDNPPQPFRQSIQTSYDAIKAMRF
jgi:sugar phosphate isomerase/epimerase